MLCLECSKAIWYKIRVDKISILKESKAFRYHIPVLISEFDYTLSTIHIDAFTMYVAFNKNTHTNGI